MVANHATSANVFDISAERFAYDVIERSRRTTVAVDFWAPWCAPCRALAPLLEQLVAHYGGRLAVARVDTDAEPGIASQFGIRNIPDVRIFRDGRMVDGFVGVQPLPRLQALFDRYVERASEVPRNEARELLAAGHLDEAVASLRSLLEKDPANTAASVDLADALTRAGKLAEAEETLSRLPANASTGRDVDRVRARIQLTRDAADPGEAESLRVAAGREDTPLRDLYRLAAHDLVRGDAGRGLDLLLSLMKRDRRFEDGLAQRALLQAFALLGDDDERVGAYRRRMAALLY